MTAFPLLPPLRIGPLSVPFPIMLAPMAGYTDAACRLISRRQGCGLTYTEVVNAHGILHGSRPTLFLLETLPGEGPVVAHIYGNDPNIMADAAVFIERLNRFDAIDVNAGCPVRKIVAKGCGAALMHEPEKIQAIVRAMTQAVSLPVTVKSRIGHHADALVYQEIALAAQDGGAAAVAFHARTTDRKHSGPADWTVLAAIKAACKIPVIGNGGVSEPDDALRMVQQTGVDGVMIGRAAIGAPWIFKLIRSLADGETQRLPDIQARRTIMLEHVRLLAELKERDPRRKRRSGITSDTGAALHFRPFLLKYLGPLRTRAAIARQLQAIRSLDDVVTMIETEIRSALAPSSRIV